MDRKQEEMIQLLTARYVSEFNSGQQPQLSEYLLRYPEYADAIADFVAYYHAIEVDLPAESDIILPLTQPSRAALDQAWKNVLQVDFEVHGARDSLHMAARNVNRSFMELALQIGLSQDILKKLDQRRIDAATLPQELCHRLAAALQQPIATVEMYLGLGEDKHNAQNVAESHAIYRVEDQPVEDTHVCSFHEALAQSTHMSDEQKRDWQAILFHEGLL
ncbi:MAG: hypothetical protein ACXWOL_01995 [Ktedonobacteraceae bacterium]